MDFAPVSTQLAAGTELGITLTTGKAPHQAAPPHGVLFQSPGASEERPAILAAEGLFPGVNSHVDVELRCVAERQTARAAQERFLARVHLLVSLQVLAGAEPRVALAAGWGLSEVCLLSVCLFRLLELPKLRPIMYILLWILKKCVFTV